MTTNEHTERAEMKQLPESYQSGTLTSGHGDGATVHLHFSNAAEAEQWFNGITGEAQPSEAAKAGINCMSAWPWKTSAEQAKGQEAVAWRAWFDADNGARWLFSLWPEEERLDVEWQPLYTTPPAQPAAMKPWQIMPTVTDRATNLELPVVGVYEGMVFVDVPAADDKPCWCETCDTQVNNGWRTRMSLCPDCGNKRCPKATHHDNACTGSNEMGQKGSSWEHVKPITAADDKAGVEPVAWLVEAGPYGKTSARKLCNTIEEAREFATWCATKYQETRTKPLYTHHQPQSVPDDVKDAERYRWLRDNRGDICGTDERAEFDAAIDAAMLKEKK